MIRVNNGLAALLLSLDFVVEGGIDIQLRPYYALDPSGVGSGYRTWLFDLLDVPVFDEKPSKTGQLFGLRT